MDVEDSVYMISSLMILKKNLLYYRSNLMAVGSVENLLASFEVKLLHAMDSTQIPAV